MRQRLLLLFFVVLSSSFSYPASAQETPEPTRIETENESAPSLLIKSDHERNAFIFVIDGEEVALLDKSGFHVRGSINFGGTITDTGSAWVDDYIASGTASTPSAGGDDED